MNAQNPENTTRIWLDLPCGVNADEAEISILVDEHDHQANVYSVRYWVNEMCINNDEYAGGFPAYVLNCWNLLPGRELRIGKELSCDPETGTIESEVDVRWLASLNVCLTLTAKPEQERAITGQIREAIISGTRWQLLPSTSQIEIEAIYVAGCREASRAERENEEVERDSFSITRPPYKTLIPLEHFEEILEFYEKQVRLDSSTTEEAINRRDLLRAFYFSIATAQGKPLETIIKSRDMEKFLNK